MYKGIFMYCYWCACTSACVYHIIKSSEMHIITGSVITGCYISCSLRKSNSQLAKITIPSISLTTSPSLLLDEQTGQ